VADGALRRPGGRTARVRTAVLDATVVELVERGYAGLTVEAIAARAGVNKTTLYRRWRSREGLIVDAVERWAAAQADVPDTGDLDEDLRRWTRSIRTMLTSRVSAAMVRAVFTAGDVAAVQHLRHRFWESRAAIVRPLVERAVARGDLAADTDVDEVIRHAGAPLYYRLLVLAEPVTIASADLAAAATATAARAGIFSRKSY
jgi:AcrR family transcriptional regulator